MKCINEFSKMYMGLIMRKIMVWLELETIQIEKKKK